MFLTDLGKAGGCSTITVVIRYVPKKIRIFYIYFFLHLAQNASFNTDNMLVVIFSRPLEVPGQRYHCLGSTVQYSTVQYSALQYSTVQYSTVQCSTVQYRTEQYSTVQYSTVQYKVWLLYSQTSSQDSSHFQFYYFEKYKTL